LFVIPQGSTFVVAFALAFLSVIPSGNLLLLLFLPSFASPKIPSSWSEARDFVFAFVVVLALVFAFAFAFLAVIPQGSASSFAFAVARLRRHPERSEGPRICCWFSSHSYFYFLLPTSYFLPLDISPRPNRITPHDMATKKSIPPKRTPRKRANPADAVDEQLARYRSMRDFEVTAEPSGATKSKKSDRIAKASRGLPFVIQKHAASHLHYDFRLGWAGVLKSWACAKGPSYNVKDRRLAVQVEDHPMEYGGFEGIIPKGQYGGGTVMVWDQGTWWPQLGHENVDAGLRDGHLKFEMNGTKMKGKWALIRMGGHAANESKPNWLLIKEHDSFERPPDAPAITDESPNSAVTGRSLEQIAEEEDHVWQSNKSAYLRDPSIKVPKDQPWHRNDKAAKESPKTSNTSTPEKSVILSEAPKRRAGAKPKDLPPGKHPPKLSTPSTKKLATLPKESQPDFISPQLALEATAPPATADWLHELKLDGYRIQARKSKNKVRLLTRKGLDWTHRMPAVATATAALPTDSCTLDGEVVVLGPDGNSNFADLQASFQNDEAHPLTYFVFDLLHLEGHNTRNLPLRDRKNLLAEILSSSQDENLRLSEDIAGDGPTIFHHACDLHAEGIISKRADAPYRSSRSSDWLKSKCLREQEFVIAGYTLSTEGPDRIGSLLLGYYENKKLIYAGRTGTGFTQKLKRDLLTQLSKLHIPKPAVDKISTADRRGALWIKPSLVAQVRFATWTSENLVRQAAFLGLREDKSPTEVVREEATVAPKPKSGKSGKAPPKYASVHPQTGLKVALSNTKQGSTSTKIRLTHPDKVIDPESGLTKQQLFDYYAAVADRMLPHIADRPLSLVRCPEGAGKPCFFQKHVNSMLPPGIGSVDVPDKKTGVPEPYITLNTAEALIGLAQLGVLEVHPWGSRNNDLEHPDHLIFDLDPDEALPWSTLTAAAAEVRKRLKKLGLESFLKLTGGKGLHIVAPIEPTLTWSELKDLAHKFVLAMERNNPKLYLTKMTKSARAGKIYLDYLRNERGATAVAPYSPRARLGTHVSLPLPWSALKEPSRPVFAVNDFESWHERLRTDPWKAMLSTTQRLSPKNVDAL
jgi:bifunctional non-homologous end joining protein LigD